MNLPNRISMVRIFLTPIMLTLMVLDIFQVIPYGIGAFTAAFVFIIAAATDGIDGHIARSRNMVTTLGKFLDSIADKILCSVALVAIVCAAPMLQIWVMVLVSVQIARDLIISALRQLAAAQGKVLAADMWGKVKACFDYVAIPVLIIAPALNALVGHLEFIYYIGFACLCAATLLSVISAIHYLVKNKEVFKCE